MTDIDAARTFIQTNGRVLDRRLFATMFEDAPASGVVDALRAYRNDDGGIGHGLEPDKRVPSSTPLDVETAFEVLDLAGTIDVGLVADACDWLALVADPTGLVPMVFDDVLDHPRAVHWDQIPRTPGINPTAGLAGFLWKWDIDHPWRDAATAGCWRLIDDAVPDEVHGVREALRLLEHQRDPQRAEALLPRFAERLPTLPMFFMRPGAGGYGLTPLEIVPTPNGVVRQLFTDDVFDGFLDELEAQQQADGGWPIAWEPPGPAAVFEWRAWRTLLTLHTLRAWGRLSL